MVDHVVETPMQIRTNSVQVLIAAFHKELPEHGVVQVDVVVHREPCPFLQKAEDVRLFKALAVAARSHRRFQLLLAEKTFFVLFEVARREFFLSSFVSGFSKINILGDIKCT